MGSLLEAKLVSGRQAAREARKLVADLHSSIDETTIEDVALLVSELVTNSYRYGNLGPNDTISLHVTQEGNTVRVEVTDAGRGTTVPAPRTPSTDGGWGLEIVRRKSARWGVDKGRGATTVWFELETAPRP